MRRRSPGHPASVGTANIPLGSIALATGIILAVLVAAYRLLRRQEEGLLERIGLGSDGDALERVRSLKERLAEFHLPRIASRPSRTGPAGELESISAEVGQTATTFEPTTESATKTASEPSRGAALGFLLELGEALLDSGTAVPQVETTLFIVATTFGIEDLHAIVLPNSLVLSLPDDTEIRTGAGTTGSHSLRLDQIDELSQLVRELVNKEVTIDHASRTLERIRASESSYDRRTFIAGRALTAAGTIMILGGTWKEVLIGTALGALIGVFLSVTNEVDSIAYYPFQPLVVAAAVSTLVFGLSRAMNGLIIFPLLVAPLITFLPGSKLTMGVLELVTGHIVAGTSRVASGAMQLVLLALGLAAGVNLVGAGARVRTSTAVGHLATIAPWIGVAIFGVGIVWVNGVFRSSRFWILLVLYVAYAGQVIGALFFGPSLSAFFGALAMTPIAVLASRQERGPSPLVTFLPAFWILVPGSLGLKGVSMLLGQSGLGGESTLMVVLTSMIGISLGILLGLTLVTDSRSSWWIGAAPSDSSSSGISAEVDQ